jgi:hypothetical protein
MPMTVSRWGMLSIAIPKSLILPGLVAYSVELSSAARATGRKLKTAMMVNSTTDRVELICCDERDLAPAMAMIREDSKRS